jgi:hypothetical protein
LDQFGRVVIENMSLKANTRTSIVFKSDGTYYLVSTDGARTTTTNKLVVIK